MLMRIFVSAMIGCTAVIMLGIAMLAAVDVGKTTARPVSVQMGHAH